LPRYFLEIRSGKEESVAARNSKTSSIDSCSVLSCATKDYIYLVCILCLIRGKPSALSTVYSSLISLVRSKYLRESVVPIASNGSCFFHFSIFCPIASSVSIHQPPALAFSLRKYILYFRTPGTIQKKNRFLKIQVLCMNNKAPSAPRFRFVLYL